MFFTEQFEQAVAAQLHGAYRFEAVAVVALQDFAGADVGGGFADFGKLNHIAETEVHALSGQRVDGMGGVAHQQDALADGGFGAAQY